MSKPAGRTSQRAFWHSYNLRWLLLMLAAVLLLAGPGRAAPASLVLLILGALANFGFMLFELLAVRRGWVTWAMLGLDFALCLALYWASGGSLGRLIWIGLLPGMTAALRLNWAAALATTFAFLGAQTMLEFWMTPPAPYGWVALMLTAMLTLPVVVPAAYVGVRLRRLAPLTELGARQSELQRSQVLRQHARAIYAMSSMVSATLNYNDVLEAALDFGARGAEGGESTSSLLVGAVLFFQDDQLRVATSRRLTAPDRRVVCPGRTGVLGAVIQSGEPAVINRPIDDPELTQFAAFQACQTLMALPLRAGYETYGVVLYGHPVAGFFDDDQRALLMAVVNQAIIALQNAQLYRNLQTEKERLVDVQEEAQKKLARDLHDGPTQSVAALAMRANFARRLVERDPKQAGEELFKMEDLARKATKEIRHMLFTLRPLVLESQGLTVALQQLAEKIKETHNQAVLVDVEPGIDDRLEMNQQGVLFYIVEEAVNNARKHAQAAHIWVRLKSDQDILAVEVRDDGVGFNVAAVDANYERRGSMGMVNMRERAEMIFGLVRIESDKDVGTRVMIYIPLTEAARERVRA